MKTIAMLAGLALVAGASIACFGIGRDPEPPAVSAACEGLTGTAREDCEKGQTK